MTGQQKVPTPIAPATAIKSYAIKGFYYEKGDQIDDTLYHYDGSDSMIDHQKTWFTEAQKLGYVSGELDEAEIIKANYKGALSEESLIAIVNDSDLMDTPFSELFPHKINAYVIAQLQSDYDDLNQYVQENEKQKDCTSEIDQLNDIQNELARIALHVT